MEKGGEERGGGRLSTDGKGESEPIASNDTPVNKAKNRRVEFINTKNTSDSIAWSELKTPSYCWYKNNESSYKNTYGAIYNWYSVTTGKLCPLGWSIPTDKAWSALESYLEEPAG